jgi:CRP-like cAMP-binding protein
MKKVLYILGALSDQDVEWLVSTGSRQEFAAGSTLVEEGRHIDTVFITLLGRLSVTSEVAGGKEIDRLGPGDIVGEMSFVDSLPPSATVIAEEDTVVLTIPRPALAMKLEQDSGFASRFYLAIAIFLSDRMRDMIRQAGPSGGAILDEDVLDEGELDPNVLDSIYLAGTRFDRILRQMLDNE